MYWLSCEVGMSAKLFGNATASFSAPDPKISHVWVANGPLWHCLEVFLALVPGFNSFLNSYLCHHVILATQRGLTISFQAIGHNAFQRQRADTWPGSSTPCISPYLPITPLCATTFPDRSCREITRGLQFPAGDPNDVPPRSYHHGKVATLKMGSHFSRIPKC